MCLIFDTQLINVSRDVAVIIVISYSRSTDFKFRPTTLGSQKNFDLYLVLFCTVTNKCTIRYVPGQHDRSINTQTVYTATTQTDVMRSVAT